LLRNIESTWPVIVKYIDISYSLKEPRSRGAECQKIIDDRADDRE
jgi:hypothetical protein